MKQIQFAMDRASIGLSCLCVTHCLLLPLALILFPVLATLSVADESFHQLLMLTVLPCSLVALAIGYRQHSNAKVFSWGGSGLALMILALAIGHDMGELGEFALSLLGSILIGYSHLLNFRLSKRSCV